VGGQTKRSRGITIGQFCWTNEVHLIIPRILIAVRQHHALGQRINLREASARRLVVPLRHALQFRRVAVLQARVLERIVGYVDPVIHCVKTLVAQQDQPCSRVLLKPDTTISTRAVILAPTAPTMTIVLGASTICKMIARQRSIRQHPSPILISCARLCTS